MGVYIYFIYISINIYKYCETTYIATYINIQIKKYSVPRGYYQSANSTLWFIGTSNV